MRKPLIGVTASHDLKTGSLQMSSHYTEALQAAGSIPLILPLTLEPDECLQLAEDLDGLLFTGGPDVHPFRFGEETWEGCGEYSPLRDTLEFRLFSEFYSQKKPLLGICRGMQLLNIALGGDIYQDLGRQLPKRMPIAHRQPFTPSSPSHHAEIEQGSLLAEISGSLLLEVNSLHHQAVRTPAAPLTVSARARDGVIEAVEHPDYPFLLGVQWHPERLWRSQEHALRLFQAFVSACSSRL